MRRILGLIIILMAHPAAADCFMFCDSNTVLTGDRARTTLQSILGAPLPAGLTVTTMREGGFQDTFYQARMTGDASAVAALLAIGGRSMADLIATPAHFGPDDLEGWDAASHPDLRSTEMPSPTLPYLSIGVAADRAGFVIYLWGFET
jgi:hypothetical protein